MNSRDILYKKSSGDENYTPAYAVIPIIKYIDRFIKINKLNKLTIWCPFDTTESEFVKILSSLSNIEVIYSHLEGGKDFYTYEPTYWDIIISNPPFTNKRGIFERALGFNKPFALLMTNTWLNDSAPKQLFKDKDLQLLMFEERIKYRNKENRDNNKITFSSSYYCYDFLPKQIIMESLKDEINE
jgi:hypothetical protein